MFRRAFIASLLAALATAGPAVAGGGNYVFDGGAGAEQAQVREALEASAFLWSIVPGPVTIHLLQGHDTAAVQGQIWIDLDSLSAGRFGWGEIQYGTPIRSTSRGPGARTQPVRRDR